jgi:hypothetical protein
MAKRHEVFPSRYLKAADLAGKPLDVDIERAPQEEFGSGADKDKKTVLYFRGGGTKPLPLNMTNWDAASAICGEDDTDNWSGHRLELYPSTTTLRGSTVDCIRIRPPRQKELLQKPKANAAAMAAAAEDDMDDDIPF